MQNLLRAYKAILQIKQKPLENPNTKYFSGCRRLCRSNIVVKVKKPYRTVVNEGNKNEAKQHKRVQKLREYHILISPNPYFLVANII